MKKTVLTLIAATANLVLGALSFIWGGILFLNLFTQYGVQIGIIRAVLSLFLLALLVAVVNSLFLHWLKQPLKSYLLLNVPMFLAGLFLSFLYNILASA